MLSKEFIKPTPDWLENSDYDDPLIRSHNRSTTNIPEMHRNVWCALVFDLYLLLTPFFCFPPQGWFRVTSSIYIHRKRPYPINKQIYQRCIGTSDVHLSLICICFLHLSSISLLRDDIKLHHLHIYTEKGLKTASSAEKLYNGLGQMLIFST